MPMPVITTRLSWGSNVSSCDDICSADRRCPPLLHGLGELP